jgi:branched-subunit amino acid aminotransferase/4-amino-4-deoxychorismate lyase
LFRGEVTIGSSWAAHIGEAPTDAEENPPKRNGFVTDVANADRSIGTDLPPTPVRPQLNGKPAELDDLQALALLNYGHFTSMQVSDGRVRGLDLHLARLESATRELFGAELDMAAVRRYVRSALDGRAGACSVRISVFSRGFQRDHPARPATPDVLVAVGAPRKGSATPLRLKTFRHERVLPHVKHVGTFPLFHYRRLAQLDGFDDALFVDAADAISEASVWNIGFFDGNSIVWPDAPALAGISMQLLQAGLQQRGVPTTSRRITRADIATFRSAFLTNSSCAVQPIAAIDGVNFTIDPDLDRMLEDCYATNPWQEI